LKDSSSAVAKTIKCYDETGSRGPPQERKTQSYLCCKENKFTRELLDSEIAAQIHASEFL
jgi:hypothetical protein